MEPKGLALLIVMVTFLVGASADLKAMTFLEKYGYLQKSDGSNRGEDRSPEETNAAIKKFQAFAGLRITGILDDSTQQKMRQSRCGVKDIYLAGRSAGMPANMVLEDKWPKLKLTWTLKKFSKSSSMSHNRQLYALRQGFRRWSEVTPLSFREVKGKADIELSFEKFKHGDNDAFDGKGSTLAHAFPPVDGRTHFDDDEEWTEGVNRGTNLEHVATHEIGHALGLYHLPGKGPVMSPYYPGYVPNFKLNRYDILEIQRRYGYAPSRKITHNNDGVSAIFVSYCNIWVFTFYFIISMII